MGELIWHYESLNIQVALVQRRSPVIYLHFQFADAMKSNVMQCNRLYAICDGIAYVGEVIHSD